MTTGSRIRYQEDMRLQKIMQQQNLNQLIDKDDLLNNYEDDDLSIELEASSMQITNFNKSFELESF